MICAALKCGFHPACESPNFGRIARKRGPRPWKLTLVIRSIFADIATAKNAMWWSFSAGGKWCFRCQITAKRLNGLELKRSLTG
jgi:hypothetical protein